MIDILIEYPYMHFKRKAIGKVPSSWDELTERQFLAISQAVDGAEPDYRFLSVITGVSREILKKLTSFQLYKLSENIDFIGRAGTFHDNFIIKELSPWKSFTAPKPKMSGITFGQFIFIDSYFKDWSVTKDETALNKFIACLYLYPDEHFNDEVIPDRVLSIGDIDLDIRKAIAFNYSLVMAWLQKAYPLIFVELAENEIATEEPKQAPQSPWLKLFDSMVGDDLINRDRYAELPLHTVFRHLTKKYKENARK